MNAETLLDLLERWQTERDRGRDLPAAELCREQPELLVELERRLHDLRRINRLMDDLNRGDLGTADHAQPLEVTLKDARCRTPSTQQPRDSLTDSPAGGLTDLRDQTPTR